MALTINPAVSGTRKRWLSHSASFFLGALVGGLLALLVILAVFASLRLVLPRHWLAVTIALPIGWAVLHDLGVPLPLPYRRQQVPEGLRGVLPTGGVAFVYGLQLGVGFLTFFTYSVQLAFLFALPFLDAGWQMFSAVGLFALGKTIVLAAAVGAPDVESIPNRFRSSRARVRILRLTTGATSAALVAIVLLNS
jgi:hypothetical protein